MTCIAGVVASGGVYIGGDSAAASGWDIVVRSDPKVFRTGPFLIGYTSSFRMGQLLRFKLDVPAQGPDVADYAYMVTTFIDAVRQCLKDNGYAKKENETESGGTFLVGYRGALYIIHSEYQVGIPADGFAAVGCGDQVAHGALYATNHMPPDQRIRTSLAAAERFSNGVRGPFIVERLEAAA